MKDNSKYLNWEKIESVLVPILANSLNTVHYFLNPTFSARTRIVGIDVNIGKPAVSEGYNLVDPIQLNRFTLNLLNEKDQHVLKDFPVSDLNRLENFGRIRIFDLFADLRKSYVQNTDGTGVTLPGAIFFNFYTIPNR